MAGNFATPLEGAISASPRRSAAAGRRYRPARRRRRNQAPSILNQARASDALVSSGVNRVPPVFLIRPPPAAEGLARPSITAAAGYSTSAALPGRAALLIQGGALNAPMPSHRADWPSGYRRHTDCDGERIAP